MEEKKKGFFSRLVEGLTKTRENIVSGMDSIFSGFSAIDDDFYEELEETLIMGDMGIQTTMAVIEDLKKTVKEQHIKDPEQCREALIASIRSKMDLGENAYEFENRKSVVLVIGVNGVGKTTSIGKLADQLKAEGKVSTDNPRKITAQDIDVFVGYRRHTVKASTVNKDLSILIKMLMYFDNDAVLKFKIKYPAHYPKRYKKRGASLEEEKVQAIFDRASKINVGNWELMEAYGLVCLSISTGFRPKELRMLSFRNVNKTEHGYEILAEHVKGEGTYGNACWVPVHPDGTAAFE